jgi:serine protease inhibitor
MQGNLVTSPLGALSVLAITQMGAQGDTQREITRSLYLPRDSALLKGDFRDIFNGTIQVRISYLSCDCCKTFIQ